MMIALLVLVSLSLALNIVVIVALRMALRAFDVNAIAARLLTVLLSTPIKELAPSVAGTPRTPATNAFEGDAHLVTLDGETYYHGPDEAHAQRVFAQLEHRDGRRERFVNGACAEWRT